MNWTRRSALAAGAALPIALAAKGRADPLYWPHGTEWETATGGFDTAAVQKAVAAMLADKSTAVLALHGGRIIAESYALGTTKDSATQIASCAKSVVSVLVGICIDQGKIKSVDQSAADFIPGWAGTPKADIKIRHLLTMTSGLDFRKLAVRNVEGDQLAINSAVPQIYPPGTHWAYATPIFHLLYHVIERAVGEPFADFAQHVLIGPLGMEHWSWVTNEGVDATGRKVTNYYTASVSARDLARFGLFALRGGNWKGEQLVSADYLRAAISPSQDLNGSYGFLWWENEKPGQDAGGGEMGYMFPGSPPDTFAALGAGGQVAIQIPSRDLVLVRQGYPDRREAIGECAAAMSAAVPKA